MSAGSPGQFYRQFALTIAFSTLLSAFNSLTLSPALAALILKPHAARPDWFTRIVDALLGWFFRLFNRGLEGVNRRYVAVLTRVVRLSGLALAVYGGLLFLTYPGFRSVPTGFIPQQDQGYLIAAILLPDAASIDRTEDVMKRVSDIAMQAPGVEGTFAITGFNFFTGTTQTNMATIFLPLTSFHERVRDPAHQSAAAITGYLYQALSPIQEAFCGVFPPPPVQGMGQAGGFKMQVEDRTGSATPQQLQAATGALIAAAIKDPRISPMATRTSFRADVPQFYANVNRVKAKKQNVAVTDVFLALQVYLGSFYINDFNYLNRTYRVIAQADAPFRAHASDVAQLKTRNLAGAMVPLGAVLDMNPIYDTDRINRYNQHPSAEINGSGAPGVSSGQAIEIMSKLAREVLPPGFGYEWTEVAYQEEQEGNTAFWVFPLCVLFVFLTHSAEYESFALSSSIILIVPMCLLCGIAGVYFSHMDNNIFTQIGFVVLAGMSVKNAVLIVEFAKQEQERDLKVRAAEAAVDRGQAAAAADPHDELRLHLRRAAAVVRRRRGRRNAARAGHRRVLRHDRRHVFRPVPHARLLHGHPQAPRRPSDAGPAPDRGPAGRDCAVTVVVRSGPFRLVLIRLEDLADHRAEPLFQVGAADFILQLHPFANAADQPGLAEDLEVLRERRFRQRPLVDVHEGRAVLGAMRIGQLQEDTDSRRIGEGVEDALHGDFVKRRMIERPHGAIVAVRL